MQKHYTLEYWKDDNWYVGRLKELPAVFSQGETLDELEENIKDAYSMMIETDDSQEFEKMTKDIGIEV